MKLFDENAIARGLVRVEPGEDLIAALEGLAFAAGWREAFVTGAGVLDLIELDIGGEVRSFERAELLSLSGHIVRREARAEARLLVQVLVEGASHAGRLVAAVTGPLLLVVEAALLPSARSVGVPAVSAPKPPTAPSPETSSARSSSPAGGAPGAKPVVAPLRRADASPVEEADEYWMEVVAGDWIDHPQLGRGEVVGDDESGGARVRIASGRLCVLRLDTLEVAAPVETPEGQRLFRIVGPKRKR